VARAPFAKRMDLLVAVRLRRLPPESTMIGSSQNTRLTISPRCL
jgi:hypothetical protein